MIRKPPPFIRMELKYCEACGALRLRPSGTASPYCSNCEHVMANLARVTVPESTDRRRA